MVRIDCTYEVAHAPDLVWKVLTHPEWEHRYTWLMANPNRIILRTDDELIFETTRDREAAIGRPNAVARFEGQLEPSRRRITWRITQGYEAGSTYVEEIRPQARGGSAIRSHGRISLQGIEWDWRLMGYLLPWKARALIERNMCRDYKMMGQWLDRDPELGDDGPPDEQEVPQQAQEAPSERSRS